MRFCFFRLSMMYISSYSCSSCLLVFADRQTSFGKNNSGCCGSFSEELPSILTIASLEHGSLLLHVVVGNT